MAFNDNWDLLETHVDFEAPDPPRLMAAALGLTDNAVRAHLTALERDGVVNAGGVRRAGTAGKPAMRSPAFSWGCEVPTPRSASAPSPGTSTARSPATWPATC